MMSVGTVAATLAKTESTSFTPVSRSTDSSGKVPPHSTRCFTADDKHFLSGCWLCPKMKLMASLRASRFSLAAPMARPETNAKKAGSFSMDGGRTTGTAGGMFARHTSETRNSPRSVAWPRTATTKPVASRALRCSGRSNFTRSVLSSRKNSSVSEHNVRDAASRSSGTMVYMLHSLYFSMMFSRPVRDRKSIPVNTLSLAPPALYCTISSKKPCGGICPSHRDRAVSVVTWLSFESLKSYRSWYCNHGSRRLETAAVTNLGRDSVLGAGDAGGLTGVISVDPCVCALTGVTTSTALTGLASGEARLSAAASWALTGLAKSDAFPFEAVTS
mmetsp:Transcript_30079/g.80267  ORF Transcript_30079/g.80267 Transcript_30079/m.80267 type:complete len:331 (-) Transcript_30079:440-1432(-)